MSGKQSKPGLPSIVPSKRQFVVTPEDDSRRKAASEFADKISPDYDVVGHVQARAREPLGLGLPQDTAPAHTPAATRREEKNFTTKFPDYVRDQLEMRAIRTKEPSRSFLLKLLRDHAGFEVRAEDIENQRGIAAKRASEALKASRKGRGS